jgi:hypothetical protein
MAHRPGLYTEAEPQPRGTRRRMCSWPPSWGRASPIAPDAGIEPHPGALPLSPANQNHLRLARILTKLRILGCENQAEALSDALDLVYRQHPTLVGEHTDGYWCSTMTLGAGQG